MTDDIIARAQAVLDAADKMTPGPWLTGDHVDEPRAIVAAENPNLSLLGLDVDGMAIVSSKRDAAGIIALRNDAPPILRELLDRLCAAESENARMQAVHGDLLGLCQVPAFTGTMDEFEEWLANDQPPRPKLAMSRAAILGLREEVARLRAALTAEADRLADEAQRHEVGPLRADLYQRSDRLRAASRTPEQREAFAAAIGGAK